MVGRVRGRRGPRPARRPVRRDRGRRPAARHGRARRRPARVVRPAKLWNDTESAPDAGWLLEAAPGGAAAWADGVRQRAGRRVHHHQALVAAPQRARVVRRALARVLLPHDWLTLPAHRRVRHRSRRRVGHRATGRRPTGEYRWDLLAIVDGDRDWAGAVPEVLGPADAGRRVAGRGRRARAPATTWPPRSASGCGRATSRSRIGTSGTVFAVSDTPTADAIGRRGRLRRRHRPLPPARLHAQRDQGHRRRRPPARRRPRRARRAGAGRRRRVPAALVLLPYLDGERTPNRPDATGVLGRPALRRRPASSWPGPRSRASCAACSTALDALGAARAGRRPAAPRRRWGASRPPIARSSPTSPAGPCSCPPSDELVAAGAARAGGRRARRADPTAVAAEWATAAGRAVEPGPGAAARRRGARRLRRPARRRGVSDPFEVLGLPATATLDEVRAARRRLARAVHPDVGGDERRMREINQAFDQAVRRLLGRPDRTDPPAPRAAGATPPRARPAPRRGPGWRRRPVGAARRAVVHHRRAAGRRLRRPRAGGRRDRRDPGRGPALPARGAAAASRRRAGAGSSCCPRRGPRR